MFYYSDAQPSARGHFFARQGFSQCPWGSIWNQTHWMTKLLWLKIGVNHTLFCPRDVLHPFFCPQDFFDQKFCPIDEKVGHHWSKAWILLINPLSIRVLCNTSQVSSDTDFGVDNIYCLHILVHNIDLAFKTLTTKTFIFTWKTVKFFFELLF